jgi:pSer/pThr/pTyr-binding forkhead associated (FHA) protein
VPENLLSLLKLCLLALLYLFFLRVLWAVWNEIRAPKEERAITPKQTRSDRRKAVVPAGRLVVLEPASQKGTMFDLGSELTVGRAAGCHMSLPEDTFVSQLHARVFDREGQIYVEDLGSTNGTYLNGRRLTAPTPMRTGDNLQIGSTKLEAI